MTGRLSWQGGSNNSLSPSPSLPLSLSLSLCLSPSPSHSLIPSVLCALCSVLSLFNDEMGWMGRCLQMALVLVAGKGVDREADVWFPGWLAGWGGACLSG